MCPYSLDLPGGVQGHVGELAEHLLDRGHDVRVLAPSDDRAVVAGELPAATDDAGDAVSGGELDVFDGGHGGMMLR